MARRGNGPGTTRWQASLAGPTVGARSLRGSNAGRRHKQIDRAGKLGCGGALAITSDLHAGRSAKPHPQALSVELERVAAGEDSLEQNPPVAGVGAHLQLRLASAREQLNRPRLTGTG